MARAMRLYLGGTTEEEYQINKLIRDHNGILNLARVECKRIKNDVYDKLRTHKIKYVEILKQTSWYEYWQDEYEDYTGYDVKLYDENDEFICDGQIMVTFGRMCGHFNRFPAINKKFMLDEPRKMTPYEAKID